ncbi:CE1759 family FMN reductase [Yimella sp. cx-51]|uniref:CE1759 family FMN reductase n=1 Tax=Yimella sp. cx-51 TaxID=2770551 RepID=UPI00165DD7DE|nr:CE1759 family FMN reductase [Yimella sp. cx-51]MBC9958298.1 NAD(P)H-dependent oxidoreductase [Yimella sp. cx-51]QTH38254.1 NAD(P)H-dependent oxidoreductase [Yimella sp. cx-51]
MTTVTVISAGLRSPSSTRLLADQLTDAVRAGMGEVEVHHIEVRDHAHAMMDALLTGFATGELREALDQVAAADAVIVVTPTFQASYSGLFKSFVDLIDVDALRGTPVLVAATGGSERHSLVLDHALRPLFAYLGAFVLPTGIYAGTADFGGEGTAALAGRIDRSVGELAAVLGGSSIRKPKVDEFANFTPFDQVLANAG